MRQRIANPPGDPVAVRPLMLERDEPIEQAALELPPPSRTKRFVKRGAQAVLLRVLLAPAVIVAVMIAFVYASTCRWPLAGPVDGSAEVNPASIGLFYRDVQLRTGDGLELAGWYIPAWSADQFAAGGEQALRSRRPGVLLCHAPWADRSQMLYLAPALHAAGYEVLLIDLRGSGRSEGRLRLGLDEWQDVQAGVTWLGKLGSAEGAPRPIAVVAGECYTAAALRVAAANPAVRAVVADRPSRNLRSFLAGRFDAAGLPGEPLGQLYEWCLAAVSGADVGQADAEFRAAGLIGQRALLVGVRDGGASADDGQSVLAACNAKNKLLRVNRLVGEPAHQPAVMPADLVGFLGRQFVTPPGSQRR